MPLNEFDLIGRYFKNLTNKSEDVSCGIGDDAAIISVPAGCELAVSTDTLVENIHFPEGTNPSDVGYKSLAVNLSDMAAMGAVPRWTTLSLTLPTENNEWLVGFSQGFAELARKCNVALVGGDMSKGPLSITVQIMGTVVQGKAITRSGAQAGDGIYVTGKLGCAALALSCLQGKQSLSGIDDCLKRLNRPGPRVKAGECLSKLASAAIDISDGLLGDLEHLLKASTVSAVIELGEIPVCEKLSEIKDIDSYWQLAIASGDDYELCFTMPDTSLSKLEAHLPEFAHSVTRIGKVVEGDGAIKCLLENGKEYQTPFPSYQHFIS